MEKGRPPFLFVVLLSLCLPALVFASHLKSGRIQSTPISRVGNTWTVSFDIALLIRKSWYTAAPFPSVGANANIGSGTLAFGDGTSLASSSMPCSYVSPTVPAPDLDYIIVQQTYQHAFDITSKQQFTVTWFCSNCRSANVLNTGSFSYGIFANITYTDPSPGNSGPITPVPPLLFFENGRLNLYPVAAIDPDGNTMSWRSATSLESTASTSALMQLPGVTMDSVTGYLRWNLATYVTTGTYVSAVIISDGQGNTAMTELTIIVQAPVAGNFPPQFIPPSPDPNAIVCAIAGKNSQVPIVVSDQNVADAISILPGFLPGGATVQSQQGTNPANVSLVWAPTTLQAGTYQFCMQAKDQYSSYADPLCFTVLAINTAPSITLATPTTIPPGQNSTVVIKGVSLVCVEMIYYTLDSGSTYLPCANFHVANMTTAFCTVINPSAGIPLQFEIYVPYTNATFAATPPGLISSAPIIVDSFSPTYIFNDLSQNSTINVVGSNFYSNTSVALQAPISSNSMYCSFSTPPSGALVYTSLFYVNPNLVQCLNHPNWFSWPSNGTISNLSITFNGGLNTSYVGPISELYSCNSTTTCTAHGFCNASALCQCFTGFAGPSCSYCATSYTNYPYCLTNQSLTVSPNPVMVCAPASTASIITLSANVDNQAYVIRNASSSILFTGVSSQPITSQSVFISSFPSTLYMNVLANNDPILSVQVNSTYIGCPISITSFTPYVFNDLSQNSTIFITGTNFYQNSTSPGSMSCSFTLSNGSIVTTTLTIINQTHAQCLNHPNWYSWPSNGTLSPLSFTLNGGYTSVSVGSIAEYFACNASTTCTGHGFCNPSALCSCFTGYAGPACDYCAVSYSHYPYCLTNASLEVTPNPVQVCVPGSTASVSLTAHVDNQPYIIRNQSIFGPILYSGSSSQSISIPFLNNSYFPFTLFLTLQPNNDLITSLQVNSTVNNCPPHVPLPSASVDFTTNQTASFHVLSPLHVGNASSFQLYMYRNLSLVSVFSFPSSTAPNSILSVTDFGPLQSGAFYLYSFFFGNEIGNVSASLFPVAAKTVGPFSVGVECVLAESHSLFWTIPSPGTNSLIVQFILYKNGVFFNSFPNSTTSLQGSTVLSTDTNWNISALSTNGRVVSSVWYHVRSMGPIGSLSSSNITSNDFMLQWDPTDTFAATNTSILRWQILVLSASTSASVPPNSISPLLRIETDNASLSQIHLQKQQYPLLPQEALYAIQPVTSCGIGPVSSSLRVALIVPLIDDAILFPWWLFLIIAAVAIAIFFLLFFLYRRFRRKGPADAPLLAIIPEAEEEILPPKAPEPIIPNPILVTCKRASLYPGEETQLILRPLIPVQGMRNTVPMELLPLYLTVVMQYSYGISITGSSPSPRTMVTPNTSPEKQKPQQDVCSATTSFTFSPKLMMEPSFGLIGNSNNANDSSLTLYATPSEAIVTVKAAATPLDKSCQIQFSIQGTALEHFVNPSVFEFTLLPRKNMRVLHTPDLVSRGSSIEGLELQLDKPIDLGSVDDFQRQGKDMFLQVQYSICASPPSSSSSSSEDSYYSQWHSIFIRAPSLISQDPNTPSFFPMSRLQIPLLSSSSIDAKQQQQRMWLCLHLSGPAAIEYNCPNPIPIPVSALQVVSFTKSLLAPRYVQAEEHSGESDDGSENPITLFTDQTLSDLFTVSISSPVLPPASSFINAIIKMSPKSSGAAGTTPIVIADLTFSAKDPNPSDISRCIPFTAPSSAGDYILTMSLGGPAAPGFEIAPSSYRKYLRVEPKRTAIVFGMPRRLAVGQGSQPISIEVSDPPPIGTQLIYSFSCDPPNALYSPDTRFVISSSTGTRSNTLRLLAPPSCPHKSVQVTLSLLEQDSTGSFAFHPLSPSTFSIDILPIRPITIKGPRVLLAGTQSEEIVVSLDSNDPAFVAQLMASEGEAGLNELRVPLSLVSNANSQPIQADFFPSSELIFRLPSLSSGVPFTPAMLTTTVRALVFASNAGASLRLGPQLAGPLAPFFRCPAPYSVEIRSKRLVRLTGVPSIMLMYEVVTLTIELQEMVGVVDGSLSVPVFLEGEAAADCFVSAPLVTFNGGDRLKTLSLHSGKTAGNVTVKLGPQLQGMAASSYSIASPSANGNNNTVAVQAPRPLLLEDVPPFIFSTEKCNPITIRLPFKLPIQEKGRGSVTVTMRLHGPMAHECLVSPPVTFNNPTAPPLATFKVQTGAMVGQLYVEFELTTEGEISPHAYAPPPRLPLKIQIRPAPPKSMYEVSARPSIHSLGIAKDRARVVKARVQVGKDGKKIMFQDKHGTF